MLTAPAGAGPATLSLAGFHQRDVEQAQRRNEITRIRNIRRPPDSSGRKDHEAQLSTVHIILGACDRVLPDPRYPMSVPSDVTTACLRPDHPVDPPRTQLRFRVLLLRDERIPEE